MDVMLLIVMENLSVDDKSACDLFALFCRGNGSSH